MNYKLEIIEDLNSWKYVITVRGTNWENQITTKLHCFKSAEEAAEAGNERLLELLEEKHDFGQGPVPAHRHKNGGGWVANTANVAETVFVAHGACVYGNAQVLENARIHQNAQVYDRAIVRDNVVISDRAKVYGSAKIYNNIVVRHQTEVYGHVTISGHIKVCKTAKVHNNVTIHGGAEIT